MSTVTHIKAKPAVRTKKILPVPKKAVQLTPMELAANIRAAARPVAFDADNKEHRQAFAIFLVNKQWPIGYRFIEEWPHTSAVTTIQTKLMHYALRKEMIAAETMSKVFDAH